MMIWVHPGFMGGWVTAQNPVRCHLPLHEERIPSSDIKAMEPLSVSADDDDLESYISESGKFRILYTTEGPDSIPAIYEPDPEGTDSTIPVYEPDPEVPYYVIQTAHYADSSYRYQVDSLGFVDPTVHHGMGECGNRAGSWQDTVITIRFSSFQDLLGEPYGSFNPSKPFEFRVHRNFDGFPDNDLDDNRLGALKATIAHEFKHVIQYATNCMQGDAGNRSWLEMDATMMENIVHPDVNDYYNYINGNRSIFHSPEHSIPATQFSDSYGQVTWMLYFAEEYGVDFWVDVWDLIHGNHILPFVEAMRTELVLRGASFETAFIRNHLWHIAPRVQSDGSNGNEQNPPVYGFSEQNLYPVATFYKRFDSLPDFPGEETVVPPRSARYLEFDADEIGTAGQAALAQFHAGQGAGLGILAQTTAGELLEYIIPSSFNNPLRYKMPFYWEDVTWVGMVKVNSFSQSPLQTQLFTGAGEEGMEQLLYGDITKEGELTSNDALEMLAFHLDSAPYSMFDHYVGDLSGNGAVTHYDAALLYRYLDGDQTPFPADSTGTGKLLPWDSFDEINPDQGTVHPIAKNSATSEVSDSVTTELRIENELGQILSDHDMDLVLSVPGASGASWNSLFIEIAIDYPPPGPDGGSNRIDLEFRDVVTGNGADVPEGWVYEYDTNVLKLAYASAAPLGNRTGISIDDWPDDLLTLRWQSGSRGNVHFEIVGFELDEKDIAFTYEAMDTIYVMGPVGTDDPGEQPLAFELHQNYPNPFNPETTISFTLPEQEQVRLEVYDITGRRVATLADGPMPAGHHSVRFDAGNHTSMSSGVYLYRIRAGDRTDVRKMTLIK